MDTYKITIKLETPTSFTDLPHFDGLLAYCYAKQQTKGKAFVQKLSYSREELIDFSKLPIKLNDNGYFEASSLYYDESKAVEFTERWRKRWANQHDKLASFGKNQRKVAINNGVFKSYDTPIKLMDIDEVWFYFRTNDLDAVKSLLKHLYGIGKKLSQGYGLIDSYSIEKVDADTKFKRVIPEKYSQDKDLLRNYKAYKPPYWLPNNFDICVEDFI